MDTTTNLSLPYILAAQAQKHVTHNEAIRALDAIVQLSVLDRDLATPPGAPAEGARYIVGPSPTGAWAGQAGKVAAWQDGAWAPYTPREGFLAWIADEDVAVVWSGAAWVALSVGGGGMGAASVTVNNSANGATNVLAVTEEELTLSGAFVASSIVIPNRAIVFAVSTRTTAAITGATSYDCGIAGETNKYGALLSVTLGGTNSGVTGPTAFYADTPIRVTANGGNFTGGKVRIAIHHMLCGVPTS